MSRTQAADYNEKRQAMLDAAAELYARSGFLGTSIADLANAWGMSKSLVYHYFSSKEEILFEIMSAHMQALNLMSVEACREPDPRRRLANLTHGFMHLYVGATAKHKVLINDLDKLSAANQNDIKRDQRSLIDAVRSTFQALCEPENIAVERMNAFTMLYFGMINWTHTWYNPAGPVSPDDLAEMTVRIVLQGPGSGFKGQTASPHDPV